MRNRTFALLLTSLSLVLMTLGSAVTRAADKRKELEKLTDRIDTELYKQSEKDVRASLDRLIEKYWQPGDELRVNFDHDTETKGRPSLWFRGYEMLGDETYLKAGLDFVDELLETQQSSGMFSTKPRLIRGGDSEPGGSVGRIEDRYQFAQFVLVCYAYKLTGDQKYLDAALKHAEAIRQLQNPDDHDDWQGPWPHNYHTQKTPPEEGGGSQSEPGYMLNDFASTACMQTMIMAYKLSGEEKYIERINRLPEYILEANIGLGNVRGWRGQTDVYNRFTWHRHFEGSLIDPRNFNRFAAPMMTYFAMVTERKAHLNMVREGYNWLKSVEREGHDNYQYGYGMDGTGGWAYKYSFDGREAFTGNYYTVLHPAFHIRAKVWLDATEQVLGVAEGGGLDAVQNWLGDPRPVKYNQQQYLDARLAAARRVTDDRLEVPVSPGWQESWEKRNFLERVRERPAKPAKQNFDGDGGGDGKWVWGLRRTPGWAAWQYVWDVRLARGEIDPDTAAWGGRALSILSTQGHRPVTPSWDMLFDLPSIAVESRSWLDIPIEDTITPVKEVELKPETITLRPGESREIHVEFTPANATTTTGVWRVESVRDPRVCWIQPHMDVKIDPFERQAVYPAEGTVKVHAGTPHRDRKATITFTTTDGHLVGSCKVRVEP